MKTIPSKRHPAGYISLLVVLSTGTLLTLLTIAAYKRASDAQSVQAKAQLRIDYSEKEESILRSILTITPNRAIRAMQGGSDASATRGAMTWQQIFRDALDLANARSSVSSDMLDKINLPKLRTANSGDFEVANPAAIFSAIAPATGLVAPGINRSFGTGYPVSLSCHDTITSDRDALYPIISDKKYDPLAPTGVGPQFENRTKFNLLKYPRINFGYAKPGEDFVAKRNWWAFSVDVAANDLGTTMLATRKRDYVLSIYEVPSQLAISAASFMSLGKYESGDEWQNVIIDGGMFVGTAEVGGTATTYNALASRRGMTFESGTAIGGETFASDPFAAGALIRWTRARSYPSHSPPKAVAPLSSRSVAAGKWTATGQSILSLIASQMPMRATFSPAPVGTTILAVPCSAPCGSPFPGW